MGDTHCLATKCSWRVGEGVSGWSRSRAAYLALVRRLLALLGDLWSAAPESQGSQGMVQAQQCTGAQAGPGVTLEEKVSMTTSILAL